MFSRVAYAVAALWLCGIGAARAGGGGADASTFQQVLNTVCSEVGVPPASCPQLPTAAQIAAEISGLVNSQIDDVRNSAFANCGNLVIFTGVPCPQIAINAANIPVKSPPSGPLAISYLTPLAFTQEGAVTQYGDPAAKRFLYAALIEGSDGQPQVLDVVLDDTLGTSKQFSKGPVAAFSLPLVILNGTESPVAATLQLTATCNGAADCLSGTVTGVTGPGKTPPTAAQLGIQFSSTFGSSPNSTTAHRTYELLLPIIVTNTNDPAYFTNPPSCPNTNKGTNLLSGYCNAFSKQSLGFTASVLGGASIGVAPYAAPLCTPATCPAQGTAQTTYFGFCASFGSVPAVTTFIQIGTDGTTIMTTPVNTQGTVCPPQG
jgi:hypothetical protein